MSKRYINVTLVSVNKIYEVTYNNVNYKLSVYEDHNNGVTDIEITDENDLVIQLSDKVKQDILSAANNTTNE